VLSAFRAHTAAREELWGKVRVTACECLGPCFQGANLVIYPDGVWYTGVTPSDVAEIVESHLAQDQPVERLVWADQDDD
jgi:(2Fe-2S) ferredoxin